MQILWNSADFRILLKHQSFYRIIEKVKKFKNNVSNNCLETNPKCCSNKNFISSLISLVIFQDKPTPAKPRNPAPVSNPDKGSHYLKKSPSPTGVKSPPGHPQTADFLQKKTLVTYGQQVKIVQLWSHKLTSIFPYHKFMFQNSKNRRFQSGFPC